MEGTLDPEAGTTQLWKTWETKSLRHGPRATIFFPGGEQYKGEWQDGKKEGVGMQIYKNGDKYEGEWVKNRPSGDGVYSQWVGDKKKGHYEVVYEGKWLRGKRHGFGTLYYPDGGVYHGDWAAGERSGFGVMVDAIQPKELYPKLYRGEFADDVKCGRGVEILATGNTFEGEYAADKREGLGCFYYLNSRRKLVGLWSDGNNRTGSYEEWIADDMARVAELWLDASGPWPGVGDLLKEDGDGYTIAAEKKETIEMPAIQLKNPARVVMNSIRDYVEEQAGRGEDV